jgi:proteasome lid subunit RPN8/RPN11
MIDEARKHYPNECCGFGLGRENRVLEVVPIRNVSSNPQDAYRMDSNEQVRAMFLAHNKGYEVVCIYHSHPDAQPIPSQTDIRQNLYPAVANCIIGINPKTVTVALWRIDEDIERLPLLDSNDHDHTASLSDDPISNIIRFIVLLGVSLIVVAVSIYLLPPPPELPLP